ncbi:uncharacterized protein LOC125229176 [Leguminivora glycinivorella]|uniref:uncharacterized protein LOC125229176 n=1 Tax=Leguminivora glycinivorella TaxID=1035111 RepID=UPI00200E5312|nr:uncharacterized protein LOC125229176 [Leguminivora glycinivorella]
MPSSWSAQTPLSFRYVAQVRLMLSTVGSWPHARAPLGRPAPALHAALALLNLASILILCTVIVLGLIYLKEYRDDISFFVSGHIFLCAVFHMQCVVRMSLARTKKYHEIIRDWLLEFHLFHFKNRSDYAAKIHKQVHITSGVITLYVMCQMASGCSLFVFMPWYNNYRRGLFRAAAAAAGAALPANASFEHAGYYYLPDKYYTTLHGYWCLFAFNCYTSYVSTIGLFVFDLLLCLMVLQIWGHLKILRHNLLNMPQPTNTDSGMYSEQENKQIRYLLKDIIIHHNLIIKFVDRCSDAFSEYLFMFYLLMQFITCVLLLEVSSFTADALVKYGPLTVGMHQQLIQVSILFEILNTKSEQLIGAVYATPWERMDRSNRKTVLFLMHKIQSPVSLKAAKMVPVGVNTMSAVLKTTFSYYMVLKALAGEQ